MVNEILQDLGLEKKEDNKLFTSGNVILQDLGLEKETIPIGTTKGQNKSKDTGLIQSGLAGIGSGAFKAAEGIVSTGALLLDLGLGTNEAAKVEKYFDSIDLYKQLEDLADDRWTGTVTELLTQFGVPGGVALKGANALLKAKNLGVLGKVPNITKYSAAGLADAAASTGDVDTIGDMFGAGPTKTRENQGEKGRAEAFRQLENKFKFGVEGALGFSLFDKAIIPLTSKALKSVGPITSGIFRSATGGPNTFVQRSVRRQKNRRTGRFEDVEMDEYVTLPDDFQFNKNNIIRAFDRIISGLRPRGSMTKDGFLDYRNKIDVMRAVNQQVRIQVNKLEQAVTRLYKSGKFKNTMDGTPLPEREKLMENIHSLLTSGRLAKTMRSKITGETKKVLRDVDDAKLLAEINKLGIPKEILPEIQKMRQMIDDLGRDIVDMGASKIEGIPGIAKGFTDTVAANIGNYLTRSYRAFGSQKDAYMETLYNTPAGREVMDKAKVFINQVLTKEGKGLGDIIDGKFVPRNNQAAKMMDDEINNVLAGNVGYEQAAKNTIVRNTSIDTGITKSRQNIPPAIRELLGEVKNPTEAFLETGAKLSKLLGEAKYIDRLKQTGKGKYFFDKPTFAEGGVAFNKALNLGGETVYTTERLAKTISEQFNPQEVLGGALGSIYKVSFLPYKALIQEAKTTLNPFTHIRNVISALSFTGINGNFFNNPIRVVDEFAEALDIVKGQTKSQIESDLGKQIFTSKKSLNQIEKYINSVRELQGKGVINTNANLGDLRAMLNEISTGAHNLTYEGQMNTLFGRLGQKAAKGIVGDTQGIVSKGRSIARGLYQSEDDFFKIQNYIAEQNKLHDAFDDLYKTDVNKFVSQYGREATKYGQLSDDLFTRKGYDEFIKNKAADTVRNNIPNYDYVGGFVRGLRFSPIGNFVSFPAEIIRTGINTAKQGFREIQDDNLRSIGMKRLAGLGLFGFGMGEGAVLAGQLAYGVSNKTINSLKEYLPDWSKNSNIVPIKKNGELHFIDFSHSNAYDLLTRPMRAALAEYGRASEEQGLKAIDDAGYAAVAELAQPFFSEAILTEWLLDVTARDGQKKNGSRIWNPSDSGPEKFSKAFIELFGRAAPLGYSQFKRLYSSGVGSPDKYGRTFDFGGEFAGIFGFRVQNPFIERGLNFKIKENQDAKTNANRELSVVFRSGATTEDIVKALDKANEVKFKADQALFKDIQAAKNLGLPDNLIRKQIIRRLGKKEGAFVLQNRFSPLKLTSGQIQAIIKNARIAGLPNPMSSLTPLTTSIFQKYLNKPFYDNPNSLFERPLDIFEDRQQPIIIPEDPIDRGSSTPIVPSAPSGSGNVILDDLGLDVSSAGTGTIAPSDRSQLAKSGDIDITEAIANRG
mgnify:CR=1 FL=1|tara:strand:+ start:1500 stop:5645 length:4146 start_codon:yes stop_codon:yes gene_type:complete